MPYSLDDSSWNQQYLEYLKENALNKLRQIIHNAEPDDTTDELILRGKTPQGIDVEERVSTLQELRHFLLQFGFEELEDLPGEVEKWEETEIIGEWSVVGDINFGYGGELRPSEREVDELLEEMGVQDLFPGESQLETTLFRLDNAILVPEFRVELASLNEQLLKYLAKHPERLHSLAPRRFEELVAELFRDFGFDIILTPRTRDGGLDVRAVRKDHVGMLLYLIECKRYAPNRPVGVDVIRGLYGVATAERASCGVIATTSHFTRDAKEFAAKVKYQMSLRDHHDLVAWLNAYPRNKRH